MGFLFKNKEWISAWNSPDSQKILTISKADFHKEVKNYITSLSDADYKLVLTTFDMNKKYSNRAKVMENGTWFCKGILYDAFGVKIKNALKENITQIDYGERILTPEYKAMIDKYQPYIDEIVYTDCIIFDDDKMV